MIEEIKRCKRCGCTISNVHTADWYSHIAIMYCPDCRIQSDKEKTALRMQRLRQRKRLKDQYRDEQLELLKQENELLRRRVMQLREDMERRNKS